MSRIRARRAAVVWLACWMGVAGAATLRAAAADAEAGRGAFLSSFLWWHPQPAGGGSPRPALGLGWASGCCRWSLALIGEGAAAEASAASQAHPGWRLTAGWERPPRRLELGVGRGSRYLGLPGPMAPVDGRVVGSGDWALDGSIAGPGMSLQAVYVPSVRAVWVHNRHVMGSAGGISLELSPTGRPSGGSSGSGPTARLQGGWLQAGPQLLQFATRPPVVYELRRQTLSGQLVSEDGRGLRWSVAGAVTTWTERDGPRVGGGWDGAGLVRVSHHGSPRWRVAFEAAGPRFALPLVEDLPVSRDRLRLEASVSRSSGALRPRGDLTWNWLGSTGQLLQWSVRLQLRPRLQGPGRSAPVVGLGLGRPEGGPEEVGLELGLQSSRRWAAGAALSPSGPGLWAWWETPWGRLAVTHLLPASGAGRVEWRWGRPDPEQPGWGLHLVYKWRPRQPDRHLYASVAWRLDGRTRLALYVGRWDRGQPDDLFGEPSRVGIALEFSEAWPGPR